MGLLYNKTPTSLTTKRSIAVNIKCLFGFSNFYVLNAYIAPPVANNRHNI